MNHYCKYCNSFLYGNYNKFICYLFCKKCESKHMLLDNAIYKSMFYIDYNDKSYRISHNYPNITTTISIELIDNFNRYQEIYSNKSLLGLTPENIISKLPYFLMLI